MFLYRLFEIHTGINDLRYNEVNNSIIKLSFMIFNMFSEIILRLERMQPAAQDSNAGCGLIYMKTGQYSPTLYKRKNNSKTLYKGK